MRFDPVAVAAVCREMGPKVGPLAAGIDGTRLLWAIAGNESSFGEASNPRHEPAYDVGGRYATDARQAQLLKMYGSNGACSYGPMQVMLVNAPPLYSPQAFGDLRTGMDAGVYALNKLLAAFHPQTISEIASCYNAGHIQGDLTPQVFAYARNLVSNYNRPLPV